jgi:predicted ribosomally synthesized peptide with SipW-like signal peptide
MEYPCSGPTASARAALPPTDVGAGYAPGGRGVIGHGRVASNPTMSNNNQFSISRRKVLAGLGTIGIASAGAGLGTTAFFSDEEAVSASLQAGRLDLLIDYRATYKTWLDEARTNEIVDGPALPVPGDEMNYVVGQAPDWRDANGDVLTGAKWASLTKGPDSVDACLFENTTDIGAEYDGDYMVDGTPNDPDDSFYPGYVDGDEGLMFSLNDVKPKDEGEATISIHLCDNPAYVGVQVTSEGKENGIVEPEDAAGDVTSEMGELAHFIYVNFWLDDDCSNTYEKDEETLVYQGSLAGLQAAVNAGDSDFVEGLQITDGCLDAGVHCVAFDWYFACEEADFDEPSMAMGAETLGDEIRAALGLGEDDEIDVNVAQTDTLDFGLSFNAVQCRHNMKPKFRHEFGEGFGKGDAGANGLDSQVAAEGKIRKGAAGDFNYSLDDGNTGNGLDEQVTDPITSGDTIPFSLSYDGNELTLDAGGNMLVYGDDAGEDTLGDIDDAVGVTVRGRGGVSKAVVENLRLEVPSSGIDKTVPTLDPFDNTSYPADDDEPERYCAFLDVEGLSDGFTLTGDATLTWDTDSSREQPAVYFFAGKTGSA